jgi:PEP-CTERM motif
MDGASRLACGGPRKALWDSKKRDQLLARQLHGYFVRCNRIQPKRSKAMKRLEAIVERLFLRGSTLSSILKVSLLVALVPVLLALPFARRNMERHHALQSGISQPLPVAARAIPLQPSPAVVGRTLYPYSVIPGGVESAAELKSAIAHDPVVARHYAGFDVAKTHVIRLDQDRMEYVSYRLGDRVFWTNRELTIRKGETLITDGTHEARTRCGNRLSENAVGPTSAAQPSAQALNSPPAAPPELFAGNYLPAEIPDGRLPLLPMGGNTPGGPVGTIIPPAYFPYVGGGPPGTPLTPPVPPPVNTPEPASILLLAAGLGSVLVFGRRRKPHF